MLSNEINKLAYIIAPVFWNLVYRSVVAVIASSLWFAISKLLDRFVNLGPGLRYFGFILVFEILTFPTPLIQQSDYSLMAPLEPIQHISYRQEYDLYENHYFIAQQDESNHYMGMPDVVLKEKADLRYIKSMVCDVALPVIWMIGTVAGGVWFICSDIALKKKIKLSGIPAAEWIYQVYENNKVVLKTNKKAEIVITDMVSVPAVSGLFKKKILLPSYTESMDRSTITNILIHEQQHIKQCDVEFSYLMMVISVVYWFNPLVAKMMNYQRQEIELVTDSAVLRKTNQDKEYITAMVDVLAQNTADIKSNHLLCMTDSARNMKERIRNIKQRAFYKNNFASIILASSFIFVLFNKFISPTFDTQLPTYTVTATDSHGAMAVEKHSSIGVQSLHVECVLPWNWDAKTSKLEPRPENEIPLPMSQFDYTVDLYQGDELIGYLGMSVFEPYAEEIPLADYHKTVWPALRLSSMCIWNPFTPIEQTDIFETGMVDINYVDYKYLTENPDAVTASAPQFETFGILAYNKEQQMYCGFAFMPGKVNKETAEKIAATITMKNDGRKIDRYMGTVYSYTTLEVGDKKFTLGLPENWKIISDGTSTDHRGVPLPLGHYGEVEVIGNIYEDDRLIGCIGVNDFTPYTGEIAPEKYWETVFSPLRLSSFFQWRYFQPVRNVEDTDYDIEAGTAEIKYLDYTKLDDYPGKKADVPSLIGNGVWAYNKNQKYYICMGFIKDNISPFTLSDIASLIKFR